MALGRLPSGREGSVLACQQEEPAWSKMLPGAQCGQVGYGWSMSSHNLSVLQMRKLRIRDRVSSAYECIQTQVWLVLKPMFFKLCRAGSSEVRTVGEWLPGARLRSLALVGSRDRYSPKRSKMSNTVTDSPEVSGGMLQGSILSF